MKRLIVIACSIGGLIAAGAPVSLAGGPPEFQCVLRDASGTQEIPLPLKNSSPSADNWTEWVGVCNDLGGRPSAIN